ncbi:MAG: hypothetical protein L6Q71_11185 [Planctomycetes bacterium]|nr:hypothetical protein [Planctomycetota bacterium]NUQ34419.1 hypothetical protein [Planctomycetaceae bacterium]
MTDNDTSKGENEDHRTRKVSEAGDAVVSDAELSPLLMVLGELGEKEREELVRRADGDPALAAELRKLSEHLKAHQGVRKIAPKRGSFSRLAERMKREKHLDAVTPGVHSMWRRAFVLGIMALIACGILLFTFLREAPVGETNATAILHQFGEKGARGKSSPIELNKRDAAGEWGAEINLATGQRSVTTSVKLARHSEFELLDNNHLRLYSGWANAVQVEKEALYPDGFIIETPNARFVSHGGSYSIKIEGEVSYLCVARGKVEARPLLGDTRGRIITEGQCSSVVQSQMAADPTGMIAMQVEPYGGDRRALITITNRSRHRLRVVPATDATSFHYLLSVSADTEPGSGVPGIAEDFAVFPIEVPGSGMASKGWVTLEPEGALGSNQYKFVADLKAALPGIRETDLTIAARYNGPVDSDDFGELKDLPWISPYARFDLKTTRTPEKPE